MDLSYKPKGKPKALLDAMSAPGAKAVWTAAEVAEVMDVPTSSLSVYLAAALNNEAVYRRLCNGRSEYSLAPFAEVPPAPTAAPASPFNTAWAPKPMVAPRPGTDHPVKPITMTPPKRRGPPPAVEHRVEHPVEHQEPFGNSEESSIAPDEDEMTIAAEQLAIVPPSTQWPAPRTVVMPPPEPSPTPAPTPSPPVTSSPVPMPAVAVLLAPRPATAPAPELVSLRVYEVPRLVRIAPEAMADPEPEPAAAPAVCDPVQVEPDEPTAFDFCTWADGTLQVWGAELQADGSFKLSATQLMAIRKRVAWGPLA